MVNGGLRRRYFDFEQMHLMTQDRDRSIQEDMVIEETLEKSEPET